MPRLRLEIQLDHGNLRGEVVNFSGFATEKERMDIAYEAGRRTENTVRQELGLPLRGDF